MNAAAAFESARFGVRGKPLAIGLVAGIATLTYAAFEPAAAKLAWTAAFAMFVATTSAALVLVFTFELTNARWWTVVRAPLIATAESAVFSPILFLPLVAHRSPAFLVRSALCLLTWCVLALVARRPTKTRAAIGLIAIAFTLTIGAFDWLMSLEGDWNSDLYGLYVFAGGFCSAMAVLAMAARTIAVDSEDRIRLGNLLLCAIMVWAYLAYFQLLLIWLPDLPREVAFYKERSNPIVDIPLALAHFVLPFLALLMRPLKASPRGLAAIGALVFAGAAIDFAWLTGATLASILPYVCIGGLVGAWRRA